MLILASNSPRRKQLLAEVGWQFAVRPAEIDEQPFLDEDPQDYVLRLAVTKARAVAVEAGPEAIIIAADTTVADQADGRQVILGKPVDEQEAWSMLRRLRGRVHQVFTGLAVLRVADQRLLSDLCVTQVPMRNYREDEIQAYIASGDPMDKAGAYAIQHPGFHPVEHLLGCYTNVVGMPLCRLAALLEDQGVATPSRHAFPCFVSQTTRCAFTPAEIA